MRHDLKTHVGGHSVALAAAAGLLFLTALPVSAQTPAQAPPPIRTLQPGTVQVTPGSVRTPQSMPLRPIASQPGRAAFPEPMRPGRAPLRLPPPPPTQPPVIVDPPPVFVVPIRERRRRLVVQHHPVYFSPHPYQQIAYVEPERAPLVPPAAVPPAEPEQPLTARDLGDLLLHWDEPDRAIIAYHEHLAEHPGDTQTMRMLGMALIDTGRVQEGVAMIALAHERDPNLAYSSIPGDVFGTSVDLRRNLNRVSVYANRVNTPSAWLVLSVLMHAEGRTRPAAAMLDRAEQAGLPMELAGPMRDAVGRRR